MKHKVYFFTLIISSILFLSSAMHIHATALIEEQSSSTTSLNKRKGISSKALKENQENMQVRNKKQRSLKGKEKAFMLRSRPSPLRRLKKNIDTLEIKIEKAYSNASKNDLYLSYRTFRGLKYSEKVWAAFGQYKKAEKWPSQESWKEVVGGHIFFPASRIHQWQESFDTKHLLERADILSGCVLASSFQHSLGLFYTTHILWTINCFDDDLQEEMEQNEPNFYTRMMQKACSELEQCLDRPDVCYALGQGYTFSPSLSEKYIKLNAIELYEKGGDFKNQCAALSCKTRWRGYVKPSIDDFLALARKGYFPAYLEAAKYAKNRKDKAQQKTILEEATQKGYALAWIELARWYEDDHQLDRYHEYLEIASQKGITWALILQGINLVGDNQYSLEREKLQNASPEDIEKASKYFRKAGQLNDPEGFEYLASLKLALSRLTNNKARINSLRIEALEASKQGCALGWTRSYWELATFTSNEEYETILDTYGPHPREMWASIEVFLAKEIGREIPKSINAKKT